MCYEGGHSPLAVGSIDNFLFELAVHPSTLQLVRRGGALPARGSHQTGRTRGSCGAGASPPSPGSWRQLLGAPLRAAAPTAHAAPRASDPPPRPR
jgi:hypothetical protein